MHAPRVHSIHVLLPITLPLLLPLLLCIVLSASPLTSALTFPVPPSTTPPAEGAPSDQPFEHQQRLSELREQIQEGQRRTNELTFPAPSTVSFTSPLPAHFPPSPFSSTAGPSSLTISPLTFGADPFALNDSTAALTAAISAMLTLPLTYSHGRPTYLSDRIIDLGGVTLDLGGGAYLISSPLLIPPGYGNYKVTRGTLRASPTFAPPSGFLLHIGNASTEDVFNDCGQCSWGANIQVTSLLLDAASVSAGGIWICGVMGAVLADNYVIGFLDAGVFVKGGHEVQVLHSWFGVRLWREEGAGEEEEEEGAVAPMQQPPITALSTAGVRIIGFDHDVDGVIVFSAPIGLYVQGACNLVQNFHTWNGTPFGVWFDGDVPNSSSAGSNRILTSYLDFSNLVLTNPHQVVVSSCFFLGGGHIVLRSSSTAVNARTITGLSVHTSTWNGPYVAPSIELDESESTFLSVQDVSLSGNQFIAGQFRAISTVARVTAQVAATALHCIDLSSALLFPQFGVEWSSLSWKVAGSAPPLTGAQWYVTELLPPGLPKGDLRGICLRAQPSSGWNATIYLEVDQSRRSQWGAV